MELAAVELEIAALKARCAYLELREAIRNGTVVLTDEESKRLATHAPPVSLLTYLDLMEQSGLAPRDFIPRLGRFEANGWSPFNG